MAITPTLPLMLAQQFGPNAQMTTMQATQAETAQAMATAMTGAMLREQSQQIQKTDAGNASANIKADSDGGGNAFAGENPTGERKKRQDDEDARPESISDPFVGHFLNRTV